MDGGLRFVSDRVVGVVVFVWVCVWFLVACGVMAWGCELTGLGEEIVEGIIAVESGGNPLALRVNLGRGRSLYPESEGLARRYLEIVLRYTLNVDVGLMQINWHTWREVAEGRGIGVLDLLDGAVNRGLGCWILSRELKGKGSLIERVGRYHSRMPGRQEWYARRVLAAAGLTRRR